MNTSLISYSNLPLRFSQVPSSILRLNHPNKCCRLSSTGAYEAFGRQLLFGFCRSESSNAILRRRTLCTRAVAPGIPNLKQYPRVGAPSTGPVPPDQLLQVVEIAAKTGAEVLSLSLPFQMDCVVVFV